MEIEEEALLLREILEASRWRYLETQYLTTWECTEVRASKLRDGA